MTIITNEFGDNEFGKIRDAVVEVLNDHGLTVGAKVEWEYPTLIQGNLAHDDPALSPVLIDDLGRLWKERHAGGGNSLECVLDLRALGPKYPGME